MYESDESIRIFSYTLVDKTTSDWKINFQTTLSGSLVEGEGYLHDGITYASFSPTRLPSKAVVLQEIAKAIWSDEFRREDVLLRAYGYPKSQITHPLEVVATGRDTTSQETAAIIREVFGRYYDVCDVNWKWEPLD